MMQMLEAAGLSIASDAHRIADPDNPRGYYELEAVKRLRADASFLGGQIGRVLKVVAPLLPALPEAYSYRVVFMQRDLSEVLASQQAMLVRAGVARRDADGPAADGAMRRAFSSELRRVEQWLAQHDNVRVCFVAHRDVLESPLEAALALTSFLAATGALPDPEGDGVDARLAARMAAVVDPALHRQRSVSST